MPNLQMKNVEVMLDMYEIEGNEIEIAKAGEIRWLGMYRPMCYKTILNF